MLYKLNQSTDEAVVMVISAQAQEGNGWEEKTGIT